MIEIIEKFTKIFKYIFSEIIEILKHNKSFQKKIITVKSAIKIENLNNHITLPRSSRGIRFQTSARVYT